jgi:RNA polymerase sigma-70 factor, ECF subfamily
MDRRPDAPQHDAHEAPPSAPPDARHEITAFLGELREGRRDAMARLVPLVYGELRRIAHRQLAGERAGHTLDTTAVVHEAYLTLVGLDRVEWRDRGHFFGVAAGAMRRILIAYARRHRAAKRGGGRRRLSLDDTAVAIEDRAETLVALDEALTRLAALDARQARVVECRFFGGLTASETAEALGVSVPTVERDWRSARAWLTRELADEPAGRARTPRDGGGR